jgi:hypothetical protein
MIIFMIPMQHFVSTLATEKESKSREGMKMMGLVDSSYQLAGFIFYIIISLIPCIISTIVMTRSIYPKV